MYVKDEDYRFSALFGHYVTMSDVTDDELDRIARLRLRPLYISIHAVDEAVRLRLLGRRKAEPVRRVLKTLADAGITFHGQIVICPGINDGDVLKRTIMELEGFRPALLSLALIPVGLTRHREGLPRLRPVDEAAARDILDIWDECRCSGDGEWLMVADELILKAGRPIPPGEAYGDYPQIENGVGLLRFFWDAATALPPLATIRPPAAPVCWVSGTSAAPFLRRVLAHWIPDSAEAFVRVVPVENRLFGASVTVSGLVSGGDIVSELRSWEPFSEVVVPGCMLARAGRRFLDDLTLRDLARKLDVPVKSVDPDAESAYKMLAERFC